MSVCGSCAAEIVWAHTVNGKRMPVDAVPVDMGNVTVDFHTDPPVATVWSPDGLFQPEWGQLRYVSHFTTCPQADRWRR